jgi:polyisoprenoid-binding protein YceI
MRYKACIITVLLMSVVLVGVALGADIYKVDKSHATVGFVVRHMVLSKVRGTFTDYNGTILLDEKDITKSSMQGTIKVASIDTVHAKRDKHLRSADFFDAAQYPEITFASKHIENKGNGYVMIGDITIRGVTKEIVLPFTITKPLTHKGKTRVGFEARLEINRQDYGIAYNKLTDVGGLVVGNQVTIEIDGEAIKHVKQ